MVEASLLAVADCSDTDNLAEPVTAVFLGAKQALLRDQKLLRFFVEDYRLDHRL